MPVPVHVYQERHLSPSILSADFARLGEQVASVMDVGARMIHFDVMDGHFVPNLTVGPAVLKSLAPVVHEREGYISVHLMIEQPEKYVEDFVRAGADTVSFHVETRGHHGRTLATIRRLGAGVGLAMNPGTGLEHIRELLPLLDFVLVMTVNPGFGGQAFIASALQKVPRLREELGPEPAIEVDGGIDLDTISQVVAAGANWLVAGSAVFGAGDPAAAVRGLLKRAMVKPGKVETLTSP
jgi:ribulose-phosphate 3-epimerase